MSIEEDFQNLINLIKNENHCLSNEIIYFIIEIYKKYNEFELIENIPIYKRSKLLYGNKQEFYKIVNSKGEDILLKV